jgi:hypothetical protein
MLKKIEYIAGCVMESTWIAIAGIAWLCFLVSLILTGLLIAKLFS